MEIARPRRLEDVLAILAEHPDTTLLAGGTDLMVEVNAHRLEPPRVAALGGVAELSEQSAGWLGAGCTYDQLLERGDLPALAEAARTVGSPQIRSVGTLGGNLGTASPAGDTLPFLAALDAEVVLASAAGRRQVRWDAFLRGPKRQDRRPGEVIVGVDLGPRIPARQAFAKIGIRRAMVISAVSCCVVRDDDGTTRIALGAVGPTVLRATKAEELASSWTAPPTGADLDELERLVAGAVAPVTDHRSTAAYRRHAAGVLARRTLARVLP